MKNRSSNSFNHKNTLHSRPINRNPPIMIHLRKHRRRKPSKMNTNYTQNPPRKY